MKNSGEMYYDCRKQKTRVYYKLCRGTITDIMGMITFGFTSK